MSKNYKELIEKVKQRSNPNNVPIKKATLYSTLGITYSDVNEYIKLAMDGVPPEYTNDSKEAAKKVIAHLEKSHGNEVTFKYQGSVETNTHILTENDIDIVQISEKSNTVDRDGLKKAIDECKDYTSKEYKNLKFHSDNFSNYSGNQLSDLGQLRKKSEIVLQGVYKDVDISKPKAVVVNVKSPLRNVDVVTAVYYKAVPYMKSNDDYKKGIQVYNKETDSKLPVEFPFWSIKRINEKSMLSNGRLKKMIRFMKNIKCDTSLIIGKPKISSFDINAICYDIDLKLYDSLHYLELVRVLYNQVSKILTNSIYQYSLMSVDGQEPIFRNNPDKINELKIFKEELDSILGEMNLNQNLAG